MNWRTLKKRKDCRREEGVVVRVDTYIGYAEALERLILRHEDADPGVPDMMGDHMTERAAAEDRQRER